MNTAFRYRALDSDGRIQSGHALASSPDALARKLETRQLLLLSAKKSSLLRSTATQRTIPAAISLQLAQLVRAGFPLAEALETIASDHSTAALSMISRELWHALQRGLALSGALAEMPKYFSPSFIGLVAAGEKSGRLDLVLEQLSRNLRQGEQQRQHTRNLLVRPLISAAVVLIAAGTLMIFLVPKIRIFLEGNGLALPFHTRALFAIAAGLDQHWPWLMLASLAPLPIWAACRQHAQCKARAAHLLLHLPVFGPIQQDLTLARMAAQLALLYRAGVPLLEALNILVGTIDSQPFKEATARALRAVEQGSALSLAFGQERIFPPFFLRMLKIGEQTGNLDEALDALSERHEYKANQAVARMQALLEPGLTLGAGLLLGWIMLATLQPIYAIVGRGLP